MDIKLNEIQRNNLLVFLNRVEVKGIDEVKAFGELIYIIQEAKEEINQEDNKKYGNKLK